VCKAAFEVLDEHSPEFRNDSLDWSTVLDGEHAAGARNSQRRRTIGDWSSISDNDSSEDDKDFREERSPKVLGRKRDDISVNLKDLVTNIKKKAANTKEGSTKRKATVDHNQSLAMKKTKFPNKGAATEIEAENASKLGQRSRSSSRIPSGWSVRPPAQARGKRPVCRGCLKNIQSKEKALRHKFLKKVGDKERDEVHQFHCRAECIAFLPKETIRQFAEKPWSDNQVRAVAEQVEKRVATWGSPKE
jgi:hypothetical protein